MLHEELCVVPGIELVNMVEVADDILEDLCIHPTESPICKGFHHSTVHPLRPQHRFTNTLLNAGLCWVADERYVLQASAADDIHLRACWYLSCVENDVTFGDDEGGQSFVANFA